MSKKRFFDTPAVSRTSFDGKKCLTPYESMVSIENGDRYDYTHQSVKAACEARLANDIPVGTCPKCGSGDIIRWSKNSLGFVRYRCKTCGHTFTGISGSPFADRHIAISRWPEFISDLCAFMSLKGISGSMRISETTVKYWLVKVFHVLRERQPYRKLVGRIVFDEYYLPKSVKELRHDSKGNRIRGLSEDQLCIATAVDILGNVSAEYIGEGVPDGDEIMYGYRCHIPAGSEVIHDSCPSHSRLIAELGLIATAIDSKEAKKMPNEKNPLRPVNEVHSLLKRFWMAHSGFSRAQTQDWMNLFSFIMSEPHEIEKKTALPMELIANFSEKLPYRRVFGTKNS